MIKVVLLIAMVMAGTAGLTAFHAYTQTTDEAALLSIIGAIVLSKWMVWSLAIGRAR